MLGGEATSLAPLSGRQLAAVGASAQHLPALFLRSEQAGKRFWEFFTANIRNRNTCPACYEQGRHARKNPACKRSL